MVPNLSTEGAGIDQVILIFEILPSKRENRWLSKASFCDIVPSEDTFMPDEIEEGVDLRPVLGNPDCF